MTNAGRCIQLTAVLALVHASAAAQDAPQPANGDAPNVQDDPPPEPLIPQTRDQQVDGNAQDIQNTPDDLPTEPIAPATIAPSTLASTLAEINDLRDRIEILEEDLRYQEERTTASQAEATEIRAFLDIGFAWAGGNGSGIRPDLGYQNFPEFRDSMIPDSWVFMGDPLSTAINARGEPADTADSRAVVFDSINSGGVATFLVNTLSLSVSQPLGDVALLNAELAFFPRTRDPSDIGGLFLGDFFDLRIANVEFRPRLDAFDLNIWAGKFDSVMGIEYRSQRAPSRIEVTPSLICRYNCGYPVGIKARAAFFDDRALIASAALTNGSHFVELFPFSSDVDRNDSVTAAGSLSYILPIGDGVEVGGSVMAGPQDLQQANDVIHWQVGAHALLDWDDLQLSAEFVIGKAPGRGEDGLACAGAPCLRYMGAYGRIGYRITNWLLPYVRVDWRDAEHRNGASFVYISELVRATPGVRFEIDEHLVLKLEYTFNVELGRIPSFANDVFAVSMVVR